MPSQANSDHSGDDAIAKVGKEQPRSSDTTLGANIETTIHPQQIPSVTKIPEIEAVVDSSDPHYNTLETVGDTSAFRTYLNLVKGFVGSGILGLPYAFMEAGVLLSIFAMIFLAIVSNYCIRLLIQVHDRLSESTECKMYSYGGLGKHLFGKFGYYVTNVSIIFTQCGFCCVYVIFIKDNLSEIYDGIPGWGYILIFAPALILISWVRSLKVLAFVSLLGQFCIGIGLIVVVGYAIQSLVEYTPAITSFNIFGFPLFFGTAAYAFEGVGIVIPLRKSMKVPANFTMVLDSGILTAGLLYIFFSTIAYIGFGKCTQGEITGNLPDNWVGISVKAVLVVAIFATYPIQLFPVTVIAERAFFARFSSETKFFEWQRNGIRAVIVLLTVVIAVSIPQFNLVVALVGAFGCSMIAFILPAIFHLKVFHHELSLTFKIIHWSIFIFGVIASLVSGGVSLYQLIDALFFEHGTEAPCVLTRS